MAPKSIIAAIMPKFLSGLVTKQDGEHQEQLEQRVRERTAELEAVNAQLRLAIEERRQAEQHSKAAADTYEHILRTTVDGFWQVDIADGRLLDANDAYARMIGYSREELLAMRVPDVEADERPEEVEAHIRKILAEGADLFETRHRRKDGSLIHIEVSATFQPATDRILCFLRDITERKQAEAALIESRNLLQSVIDTAPIRVFWKDRESRFLGCNRSFAADGGFSSPLEVIGKDDYQMAWKDEAEDYRADDRSVMESGISKLGYDEPQTTPDGRIVWLRTSKVPLRNESNEVIGVLGIYEDITGRKRADEELEQYRHHLEEMVAARSKQMQSAKEQAEAASLAKSQFLSRMSHELRTPLNAILGFAQIMDDDDDRVTIGEERDSIKTIMAASTHLLKIINDLLDLSAIEANKVEIDIEPVDAMLSIAECIKTVTPLANKRGISLNYSSEDGATEVFVQADKFRLRQVLLNLLSNAVKYNHQAGDVQVVCRRVSPDRVRISVSDGGPGIPRDDLVTLFEPFSRLHKRHPSIEGAGIGLAVAKQLTELMQGAIGVDSEEGRGSTFWVEFEQGEAVLPQHPQDATGRISLNVVRQAVILYIEDSPSHLKLMERIVRKMGDARLITAHSPHLGLELARTNKPCLILCDIDLPDMNGFAVLEHLSAHADTSHIPVIAISASAMPREVEAGLRAGFLRYLTKPLDVGEVQRVLRELL